MRDFNEIEGTVNLPLRDFIKYLREADKLEDLEMSKARFNQHLKEMEKRIAVYQMDLVHYTVKNVTVHGEIADHSIAMQMIRSHYDDRKKEFANVLTMQNIRIGDRAFEIPILSLTLKEDYQ